MPCFIIIYLLFDSTLLTDSLSSPATLCLLQSALRGSTGTAAASRVRNACTAPDHAIMSRATVSACLASLALCATKASSLLRPFDLFLTALLSVIFIHCEVLFIATGKRYVRFIVENVLAFCPDMKYKNLHLDKLEWKLYSFKVIMGWNLQYLKIF